MNFYFRAEKNSVMTLPTLSNNDHTSKKENMETKSFLLTDTGNENQKMRSKKKNIKKSKAENKDYLLFTLNNVNRIRVIYQIKFT